MILSIEASTKSGSVALLQDDQILGNQQYNLDKSHSSLLHVMIEQLMSNCALTLQDLDAIAIAEGPGSYTGLRIGTSSAKGLCYSLDIPLIAINTLESMAYQVYRSNKEFDLYCPMIDARRMEVYTLLTNNEFKVVNKTEPVIIDADSYATELIDKRVLFFGDGAFKCKDVIVNKNAFFLDDIVPSAVDVCLLAKKKFDNSEFENVISFEPFYLKEFRLATAKNK